MNIYLVISVAIIAVPLTIAAIALYKSAAAQSRVVTRVLEDEKPPEIRQKIDTGPNSRKSYMGKGIFFEDCD